MDRLTFIARCDTLLKLIRAEAGLTQEQMAYILGLSKKTLVDIEKERRSLGWMGSVVLCTLFQDSEVLSGFFGGRPDDIIMALALEGKAFSYHHVRSGRIWWTTLYQNAAYSIQQNIISQHYRLLSQDGCRIASSFDIDDLLPLFNKPISAPVPPPVSPTTPDYNAAAAHPSTPDNISKSTPMKRSDHG
ncbi:MAG: hypothetical protein LBG81_04865 [Coriobacteriaceae bacterium]|nr:hypothetical protein [Coriobacteriaceae bacterium]